jgi:hypothetical protein
MLNHVERCATPSQRFPRVATLVARISICGCVTKVILRIRPIYGIIVSRQPVQRFPKALNTLLSVAPLLVVNTVGQTDLLLRLTPLWSRHIYCEHCERGTAARNRALHVERPFAQTRFSITYAPLNLRLVTWSCPRRQHPHRSMTLPLNLLHVVARLAAVSVLSNISMDLASQQQCGVAKFINAFYTVV